MYLHSSLRRHFALLMKKKQKKSIHSKAKISSVAKTRKTHVRPTALPKRRKVADVESDWVMPFDATFPGRDEIDFILENEDEDNAVIFSFEGDEGTL